MSAAPGVGRSQAGRPLGWHLDAPTKTRPVRKYLPLLLASEGRAQGWFRGSVWLGHTSETRKDRAQLRPLKRPPLCFLSLSARKTLSIKVCPLG